MFTEQEHENFKTIGINELTNVFNTKQYVQDKYNVTVYNNQIEIFESVISPLERHIVIGQARGAGKSYGVALSLIELCRTTPKLIIAIFAPKGPQSKRLLNEMYQIISSSTTLIKDAINWEKSSSMVMEFMNGAKVQALSGNDKTMSEGEHPNCMDYSQNILLENRSEMPIGYIVENKINANVVCYNESKKEYEIKPIVGWHKNKLNGRKMLRISFQYDKFNRTLECTEDHEILMLEGYKQAKHIAPGGKDIEGWDVKWIKEIENYNQEYVYDITVKDNHNYIANSIIVHNCVVVDESLAGSSKILCEDKVYRTIKEIVRNKLNVNVATQNLETDKIEYTPVLNYWEYPCTKECVIIDYEVNGKNLQLKCTEDHLIYTTNRGYVQAKSINYSDKIIIYNDNGKVKKVTSIKQLDIVYDIETKNHNFFANDMLVHNSHLVSDFAWSSKIYPMLGSHPYKKIIKIGVFMYNNHYHKDFLDKSKRNPIKKIIYPWDKCDIYWNDDNRIVYKGFKMNKEGVYEWDGTSQECPQYIYSCMPINIKKKYFPLNPELWEGNGQMTEQDFRMQMEMEWLDDINLVLKEEQWLAMQNGTHMLEERGTINDIYIFGLDPATGSVNPETLDLDYTALSIWKLLDKKFYNVFNKQWQGDTLLQYDEILRILKSFHVAWGLLDFSSLSPTFLPMLQRDGIKCAGVNYQATHPGSGKNWKNFIFNNFVSQIDLGNIFTPKEEELTPDNEKYKFFDKDILTATAEGLSQWHIINRQRSKKAQNDIIGAPYKEHDDTCLVGQTLIPLADGRTITIEELTQMSVDNLYTYSLDLDTMLIQRGKILKAWCVGEKKIIKIILDNDECFECTEDHLIMLRDGTYKMAKNLKENDSLMPLYRRITKGKRKYAGYELTKCLKSGQYIATHKLFTWGGVSPDDTVVHHKDYNKRNNNPENLEVMTQSEHICTHNNDFWKDLTPEQRSERNKKGWKKYTEEQKQQRVKNGVQALDDYRKNNIGTEKDKQRRSAAGKKRWENLSLEARKKHIDGLKKYWESLTQEERSMRMANLIKKAADANRGKPSGKKGMPLSEDTKRKMSEIRKRKIASGEIVPWNKGKKKDEYNHKVKAIIDEDKVEAVYDMEVEKYHNFALQCGVFVHNCNAQALAISSVYHPDAKTAFNMYGIQKQSERMPIKVSRGASIFGGNPNMNQGRR